jgi:hypothetical protein
VEDAVSVSIDISKLDQMQSAYKAAVDAWIAAIRHEEELASADHSIAQVDEWENAGFQEAARNKAKAAKKLYEGALRQEFFNF